MRKATFALLALTLAGCHKELASEAAVRAAVHYQGFRPGCVRMIATDGTYIAESIVDGPGIPNDTNDTLVIAVYRQDSWGHALTLTALAYEQTCGDKSAVATDQHSVTVVRGQVTRQDFTLQATDNDGDGYVAQPQGTDCDDNDPRIHPGVPESCDGKDNNCNGQIDEGFNVGASCPGVDGGCGSSIACASDGGAFCNAPAGILAWPDKDNDGYGAQDAGAAWFCPGMDASYALNNTDCDDTRANVHPGAPEICDGLDNNCNGQIDEGFNVGATCSVDAGGCSSGTIACAADGGSLCNVGTSPVTFYFDNDDDGYGRTATGVVACVPPDAGYVRDGGDCDDGDPYSYPGAPEICDQRDNNCNGLVDELGVCGPLDAGNWTQTLIASNESYQTASAFDLGAVWIAGNSDTVRYKLSFAPNFNYASCGTSNTWQASWAAVDGGHVYLGSGNQLYEEDPGSSCTPHALSGTTSKMTGLVGIPDGGGTAQVFGVGLDGKSFVWNGGPNAVNTSGTGGRLFAVHGVTLDALFAVGDTGGGPSAQICRFNKSNNKWTSETLPAFASASLQSVWVVNPGLAYAVGTNALMLTWDGTSWSLVNPPVAGNMQAVLAFGTDNVFVASSNQIFRSAPDGGWDTIFTLDAGTGTAITGLTGLTPAEIWAPTDGGIIVHWPN